MFVIQFGICFRLFSEISGWISPKYDQISVLRKKSSEELYILKLGTIHLFSMHRKTISFICSKTINFNGEMTPVKQSTLFF